MRSACSRLRMGSRAVVAAVAALLAACEPPDGARSATLAIDESGPPFELYTSADHPEGLDFAAGGGARGTTLGDYNGDGFVDVFVNATGRLWTNEAGRS